MLKLSIKCVLKAPTFVSFSRLKNLVFVGITFSDDDSTQYLFSSCPVLQELALINCGWNSIKTLTISIPTLKRLNIEDNRKSWADVVSCVVKVHASNLIYLKFTSNLKVDFHFCDLSSLVNASIDLPYRVLSQQDVSHVIQVLTGICNLRSLTVSADTLESISYAENVMGHLPTFPNMTDLELSEEFNSYLTGGLINLLEKSPKLEFLDFAQGFDLDYIHDDDVYLRLETIPFGCCFKWLSLSSFRGQPAEMHFLRLLLKNATMLERMTLYCDRILSEDSEKQEEVNNQLRAFAGSESCVIELH